MQNIHDSIEIKLSNKETLKQLNLLKPEYLDLSKSSIYYFCSLIDYSTPETKLMSIYNYIECIIYEIKTKKGERDNIVNRFKKMNLYKIFELVNLSVFIILNIMLIVFYSKSLNQSEEEYNQIDNDQNFKSSTIISIIEIIILVFVHFYWLVSRSKIDYFYSLTKYSNEYFEENEKLKMSKKVELLKRDCDDFFIDSFFPGKDEEKSKISFKETTRFESVKNQITFFCGRYLKVIFIYIMKTIYILSYSV